MRQCCIPAYISFWFDRLLLLIIPREPAIHEIGRASDIVRVIRSKENRKARDVIRFTKPRERNLCEQRAELLRVVEEFGVNRRLDCPRSDRIDINAKLPKLHRKITCQHLEAALTGAIRG